MEQCTQQGVAVIATAHGFSINDVMSNPALKGLFGGVQTVILSD